MLEMLNTTANWEISSCKRGSCRPRANWRNYQANLQNTGLSYEESDATGLEWNERHHQNVSQYIHLDASRIGLLVNDVLPNVPHGWWWHWLFSPDLFQFVDCEHHPVVQYEHLPTINLKHHEIFSTILKKFFSRYRDSAVTPLRSLFPNTNALVATIKEVCILPDSDEHHLSLLAFDFDAIYNCLDLLNSGLSVSQSVTTVRPAKPAERIEMYFRTWTRVDPRNHVLKRVHNSGILRIRLNHPCVAEMQPYVILLWPFVMREYYQNAVHLKKNLQQSSAKIKDHDKWQSYKDWTSKYWVYSYQAIWHVSQWSGYFESYYVCWSVATFFLTEIKCTICHNIMDHDYFKFATKLAYHTSYFTISWVSSSWIFHRPDIFLLSKRQRASSEG